MAKKKAGGVTRGNRDSISKRLGIKIFGGSSVSPGNIIVRQRGTKFHSGKGTKIGRDYTIFAVEEGVVKFKKKHGNTIIELK